MYRGRGFGTPRGRGRQSWQKAGVDASSNGPVSSSLGRKSHNSSRSREFGSRNDVKHHEEITPPNSHGRGGGWSSCSGESYSHGGRAKEWRVSPKSGSGTNFVENGVSNLAIEDTVASSLNHDQSSNVGHLPDVSRQLEELEVGKCHSEAKGSESINLCDKDQSENSVSSIPVEPRFDICPPKSGSMVALKPPLMATNREKRNELKRSVGGPKGTILRPGMLLFKNYLSSSEQADVLRICRKQGLGPAGFYQPGFRDGGKLNLKMMCFGKFWDPETNKYWELRPMDDAKPPHVPQVFLELVDKAMKDSYSLIAKDSTVRNVMDILPAVKPDICLVNYYAETGRLGLHQDKDESRESLGQGIPVVSFSIGDSAEFLYCDERDVEKAEKITLESGDVLIFGGKSRHVFHGVSAILPDSAPKSLLEETNFRPGRLNLTFRQYL